jgi:DNA ligase 1
MRRFAALFAALDGTTSTNRKVEALVGYFEDAPPRDAAWAVQFLIGERLKRFIPHALLWRWALDETGLPEWLGAECYSAVGDAGETIALMVDSGEETRAGSEAPLHEWIESRILPLRALDDELKKDAVTSWWRELPLPERFLLNKLLTGEFRVGVSRTLVVRALARAAGVAEPAMAHRLMGTWVPSANAFEALLAEDAPAEVSRPYPFFLASPLAEAPSTLGARDEWLAEWKWDGIRGQLLRRGGEAWLWSRGEELITERFPEIAAAADALPEGTVLDGEILAFEGGKPLPFSVLQRRIGRLKLTPSVLRAAPIAFIAYDLLEEEGRDIRDAPLSDRRARLARLIAQAPPLFRMSEEIDAPSWDELAARRAESRSLGVEGIMLKRRGSPYAVGRRRGDWWKWKIDPYAMDAVLIYAAVGQGRRSTLFTDYTFAVWDAGTLVPVAKAYSGLSDAEIAELDKWIRQNTEDRFGPVRAVTPTQVFELHFEAIAPSPRHKSGIAVRFPRIARWRKDKPAAEADTLESLRALL